jgi:hypothetical protein
VKALKSAFELFVARFAVGDPAVDAFKAHIRAEGFPKSTDWGNLRLEIRRAGADDNAVIGARAAWQTFKIRSR